MTTAINRFITELTAAHFQIEHLLATEPEIVIGVFSGATTGILNARRQGGAPARLAESEWRLGQYVSTAYSDSINDLPLLEAVTRARGRGSRSAPGRHRRRARLENAANPLICSGP